MEKLLKIERTLFYFLALAFFWQLRLVWLGAGNQFSEWGSFFLYATDIIIAAILILWLIRSGKAMPVKDIFSGANISLAIFLSLSALSILAAQDKGVAIFRLAKLLEMAGLYFYVRYNFSALYGFKKFWQWLVAGAALQSIVAITQFFAQKSLGLALFAESPLSPALDGVAKIVVNGEKIIRAYGLVPHPNILAAILMVAIFGLVWLWLEKQKNCHPGLPPRLARSSGEAGDPGSRLWIPAFAGMTKKRDLCNNLIYAFVFIILIFALFVTFSRGAIILGGGLFLIWLIYLWRQKEDRQAVVGVFFLFAIGYLLLAICYWPYVYSRYDIAALPGSQSIDLRAFYNQEALKIIVAKPFLGVGQGNFTVALRDSLSLPDWQYQPAHNIYLLAAAENGLAVLLAFLAFLFFTLKSVWPRWRELAAGGWLFIFCFLLLIGFSDHFLWDLQQGQILFWLTIGIFSSLGLRSSRLR